jgi:signal peptidase I
MMPAVNRSGSIDGVLVHTLRRVVAWVLGLVLVAGTATALGVALFAVVTGGAALAVLSGSMTPGLPVGGMAFVRPVDVASVQPGDVITFQREPGGPELVTHRVLAVDDAGGSPVFTTKGDANEDPDVDPVPASAVRGKLWFGVPHVGRLAAVLHSPKGAGLLVVLVCGVIAAAPGPRPGRTESERNSRAAAGRELVRAGNAADEADLVGAADARTVVMPALDDEPSRVRDLSVLPLPPVPPRTTARPSAGPLNPAQHADRSATAPAA